MNFVFSTQWRYRGPIVLALAGLVMAAAAPWVQANEATIRQNLAQRLPNLPPINEIRPTPMPGLFEVRLNQTDILYTDAAGNFILQGNLIDTQTRVNLTEQRTDALNAIAWRDLPLRDAFTIVRGNGQRRMAIFQDPNCGFCKRLERDAARINNVTIHIFLYPVLGPDSMDKSRNIWCARQRVQAWENWMLRSITPPNAPTCDAQALQRNLAFAQSRRIQGTPTLVFADGTRVPGAIGAEQIEQLLTNAR